MSLQPLVEEARTVLGEKAKLGTGKRFAALVADLKKRSDVESPEKLAAWIGSQKYGKTKMSKMARAGKKRKAT